MNTLKWILLINLLTAAKEIDGVGNSNSGILPLILLEVLPGYDSYQYPEHIERLTTHKGNITGGTKFFCSYNKETCKQIIFCPPESSISNDYLFSKKFGDDDILQCANEANPFVEKITYKDETGQEKYLSCGFADKTGVLYKTGYNVCVLVPPKISTYEKTLQFLGRTIEPTSECSEFKVFRFCYNEKNKEVLYTDHETRSPQLFTDKRLQNEFEKTFEIISNGYGKFGSILQNDKTVYEQLNSEQTEYEYTNQWLVPPEDLVFALWKKTAYNYFNIGLMRKDQLELWNYINDHIKKESIKIGKEFSIHTAAVLLSGKAQQSYAIESIEKPDIWIKFVYYCYDYKDEFGILHKCSGSTIIMNSNLDERMWQEFYNKYCDTNLCENVFNKKFPTVGNTVRCCYGRDGADYFNLKNFPISSNTLNIDFFLDDSSNQQNRDSFIEQAIQG